MKEQVQFRTHYAMMNLLTDLLQNIPKKSCITTLWIFHNIILFLLTGFIWNNIILINFNKVFYLH